MLSPIKKQLPVRIIALGFLSVIFLGSILLIMPFSIKDGVSLKYIDALYTSASAVCVTGLTVVDAGTTFTPIGQTILLLLIQVGGLGVTTIGAGIILAIRRKMSLSGLNLIKEGSNLNSKKGIIKLVRDIFITTIIIEAIGAILSFIVFIQDLPFITALGVSIFHSVATFNNSGFDILGGLVHNNGTVLAPFASLIYYKDNVLLNLTTSCLIILGGIGFLVIKEVIKTKCNWKKFSMHTKVVLTMTLTLIISGTLLLKLTEDVSFMGALFLSISSRTAGFSTYSMGSFSTAGLLVLTILMFIGASPGSTGGGIKTTTFATLLLGIKSSATNKSEKAFKYSMPKDSFKKASVITLLALFVILVGTYLILVFDATTILPEGVKISGQNITLIDALFESTSAFGTVGLSTGITPYLSVGSKIVSIITMYIGRLGPLTIATLWFFSNGDRYRYPEGNIAIG